MQPFTVQIGDGDTPIPGDVNGDGSVSATDALIILNLAIGIPVATNPPSC